MEYDRKNIVQPRDWWEAFQGAADRAGLSLSEWVGDRCREGLTKAAQRKLSDRRKRGPQPNGRAAKRSKG